MKASIAASILLLFSPIVSSLAVPRADLIAYNEQSDPAPAPELWPEVSDLEKRRGGGGGGGKSSGSSSSSGSSGSGSSSSSSSSGSKGSSSSGSKSGSTSSSSNAGGTTKSGSGTAKSYGNYYAGGATTPFTAGGRTASGILPYALVGGALGFAAASAWHYPYAYGYPYPNPYYYHDPVNTNNNDTGNYTMNVVCYCDEYSVCGCDGNNNSTYLSEVIGDPPRNSSIVTIVQNGTNSTAYINGTLANGTTAADSSSGASAHFATQSWLPVAAMVSAMIYLI